MTKVSIRSGEGYGVYHTSYITEDELKPYYFIRTTDEPRKYRVGAKRQAVPKLYTIGSARAAMKKDGSEELIPILMIMGKPDHVQALDRRKRKK